MKTAVMMFCVIAGLGLLGSYPLLSLPMFYGAYAAEKSASAGDEEQFVAVLMILGGVGALAVIVTGIWNWLTASP
jgi:hypothetical protein